MAQRQAKQPRTTFDEFPDWERRQETKHEFLDGVAVAMAGATEARNIIQTNLLVSSATKPLGTKCRPFASDMPVDRALCDGRGFRTASQCLPSRVTATSACALRKSGGWTRASGSPRLI
jgi:hypothetical protein